ncbi:MAG: NAD(P)-binding domain-containing protein [Eggerthellales bacterium]|nr:NAD(P)-binding domain-containing protein [Eggerthellales bacterium]
MATTFFFGGNKTIGAALTKSLTQAGYEAIDTIESADFVFTYHTALSQLEDAYFDEKGYLAKAKKGAYLIDLSPATPELVREISAIASVSDLFYVEAPLAVNDVTLPDAFADASNLACCLAGDRPDVAAAQELLRHFVGAAHILGETGSAQLAHAAWALQHAAMLLAAVEAEALYRAMLRIPTSASAAAENKAGAIGPQQAAIVAAIAEKRFAGTYTVEMFMADLTAALTAADDAELILPQAEACMNLLELLAIIGGSDMSPVSLALIYDEEEAASKHGLDWSRAEEYSAEMGAHSHEHHDEYDDDDDDDFGGYADLFGNFTDN